MQNEYKKMVKKDVALFSGLSLLYSLVLGLIAVLFTVTLSMMVSFEKKGASMEEIREAVMPFVNEHIGFAYFVTVPIGLLIFWIYRQGKLFKSDIRTKKNKMTLKIFAVLITMLLLSQLIFYLFNNLLDYILTLLGLSMESSVDSATAGFSSWPMLIYAGFTGPISEELIFRGAGLAAFKKYGKVFAIIMSSLIFGIFHANISQIVFAAVIGVVFAYISFEYSIFWAISLHIFNNFVIGDGLTFLYSFIPDGPELIFHLTLLLLGSALALLFLYRKRREIKAYIAENKPVAGTFSAAFSSVWFWVFAIYCLLTAIFMLFQ